MLMPELLHTMALGSAIVMGAVGSGIGEGIAGYGALEAISRQILGTEQVFRTMIFGIALIESGVILALVITLMILFGGSEVLSVGSGLAELGMGCAIGFAALGVSIASSFAVRASCVSLTRQPFFSQKIITMMLLSQSIIEAPVVFAFIIALLIKTQITSTMTIIEGIKLLAAGLAIGVGSIGPSIGQALFTNSSCIAIGLKKEAFGRLLTFSLLSQAVVQTPVIFCLLISIMTIYKPVLGISSSIVAAATFFSPAFAIAIGSCGSAIGIGFSASRSSYFVAMNPENYPVLIRASLLGQVLIESSAIYALIVALVLLTKTV